MRVVVRLINVISSPIKALCLGEICSGHYLSAKLVKAYADKVSHFLDALSAQYEAAIVHQLGASIG